MSARVVWCVLAALVLVAPVAWAEDPWDAEQPDPAAVAQALEQARTALANLGEPTTDTARIGKEALARRVTLLTELAAIVAPATGEPALPPAQLTLQVEARRAELDSLLRRPVDLSQVEARTTTELAALEETFKSAQATFLAKQQALTETRERRARLERELKRTLPERAAAAQAESAQALPPEATPHEALVRGNTRLVSRIVQLRTARAAAELERATAEIPLLEAELDLARLRQERAQVRYLHGATLVRAELLATASRERRDAEQAGEAAERDSDPVRRLRRRMRAERDLVRADTKKDAAREADLETRKRAAEEARDAAQREQERLSERLDGGTQDGLAAQLLEIRARVRRQLTGLKERRIPDVDREIADVQVVRTKVLERLWQLDLPDDENAELIAFLERVRGVDPSREAEARIVFGLTVRGQDGLIAALRARLEALNGNIQRLESLRRAMLDRADALRDLSSFVLGRLVWVRSDPVLAPAVVGEALGEVARVGTVASGDLLGRPVLAWYREAPVPHGILSFLLIVGFFALLMATRTLRRPVPHPAPRKMALPAIRATWSALWRSALLPAYVVLAVLLVRALGAPAGASRVIGETLVWIAAFWFALRFSWRLFRSDGVAVGEFRMAPPVAAALQRASRWLFLSALVFEVPGSLLAAPPFDLSALPRLLHTAFAIAVTIALARLLRPTGPFLRVLTQGAPFWRRTTNALAPLAVIGLGAIVLMEILGYRTGARFFLSGALQTAAFLFLILGLHQLVKRLIQGLAERVRRQAAKAAGRAEAKAMSTTVVSQLSQVALVVLVIAAVLLLGDVWALDTSVSSLFEGITIVSISETTSLTLWDAMRAIAYIVFAHFVSRNMGAVLDAIVFPATGTTNVGTRYVTLALLRYAILLFGYGAALLTMHFSFSSLGWALAAISFGIGFGMQEIVANFVSGLILLLERPVRVGDIVSVGDTGGVVEQITVRSTVVTNWEQQQIIVPNKNFITQNVTNWTRQNQVVRRKIVVGVAYGSDVELVLRILREVATAHPAVQKEPPPRVLFMGFGESSLDFEVWIYANYDVGLAVRSELTTEIDRRFREAGVTIPFPQRDLHIKEGPGGRPPGP